MAVHRPAFAITAGALLVAGLAVTTAAQAHPAPKAHTGHTVAARAQSRALTKYASTSHIPASRKHPGGGAANLTEDGTLQRFVNRSDSARPKTTTGKNGARVLRGSSADSWVPTVSPTPVTGGTSSVTHGWQGLNEYDNQVYAGGSLEPPDQGMCAGNGQVLELINDVVQVYSSSGAPLHGPVYLNDFFNEPGYQFTTDPSCVYDAGSNRFIATQLTLEVDPNTGGLTGNDWLDLAVSKSGDALGGYNYYRIYVTDDGSNGTPSHTDCPCIGDFPHLGTDRYGVYLTTNEYPFSSAPGEFGNNFNGAQLYALSKSAVVSGASDVAVTQFQSPQVKTSGARLVGFTLWPAQSAGSAYDNDRHGTMNFLSSFAAEESRPDDFTGHSDTVGLWSLRHTASLNSTPNLRLVEQQQTVGSYGIPPLSNQKAGPVPLKDCLNVGCVSGLNDEYAPEQEAGVDSSDTRMLTAGYANGQVYGALDTAMNVSGNIEAGFEWFLVNAGADSPATVAGNGYVGVAHNNVTYPSIATDPSGNGYIGMSLMGDNYYPSAVYQSWSGAPGSSIAISGRGRAPSDGFCAYLYFNCAGTPSPQIRPRWGDYGYAAWDGQQFFVANEYIAHSCDFSTFDADHTCGGNRTFYGNFSTHITALAAASPAAAAK